MTDKFIHVDGLNIDYRELGWSVPCHFLSGQERLALVGESGSGKSMTARALMGLVRKPGQVSARSLQVLGQDALTPLPTRLATPAW